MKLFLKLFLCLMTTLTLALAITEVVTVSGSFKAALSHQQEDAMGEHQLVRYALQSALLTARQNHREGEEVLQEICQNTEKQLSVSLSLSWEEDAAEREGVLNCRIHQEEERQILQVTGYFPQGEGWLKLITSREISAIYRESRNLQETCRRIFWLVEGLGMIVTLGISWLLTRSVRKLENAGRKFAEGDYSARALVNSGDEIGDLATVFNAMADTIQEKIRELERAVEQREDFVANFAHELKTPMTSIIGYADMIQQKDLAPEEVKELSGIILNEGMRLEALSFKLLELITLDRQSFVLEEMEMRTFLGDVAQTAMAAAARREVRLMVSAQEGYARIEYDLMKTLLMNLLDNAMKSGTGTILIRGRRCGDCYQIQVRDHGRGIPPEERERITEAFYMVDKARSRKEHGAGLGLALCSRIAEIHHTHLQFSGEEGQGTVVELELPLCQEVTEE